MKQIFEDYYKADNEAPSEEDSEPSNDPEPTSNDGGGNDDMLS